MGRTRLKATLRLRLPSKPSETPQQLMTRVLREAASEVAESLRHHAPLGASGDLRAGFNALDTRTGARFRNPVRYSGAVREFAGAPPIGVLAFRAVRERAAEKLRAIGTEVADAALHEIMAPMRRAVTDGD